MVVHVDGANADRGAGEEHVARLQCEEAADVADEFIHLIQHVARTPRLHRLPIDVEVELQILHFPLLFRKRLFANPVPPPFREGLGVGFQLFPLPYRGTAVEGFGYLPGVTVVLQPTLQVAGGEVDAHGHGVVVAVSKALADVFAKPADAHHHFHFMIHPPQMLRQEEWLAVLQQCRLGFHEHYRLSSFILPAIHLLVMEYVVFSDAKDFHVLLLLKLIGFRL